MKKKFKALKHDKKFITAKNLINYIFRHYCCTCSGLSIVTWIDKYL